MKPNNQVEWFPSLWNRQDEGSLHSFFVLHGSKLMEHIDSEEIPQIEDLSSLKRSISNNGDFILTAMYISDQIR